MKKFIYMAVAAIAALSSCGSDSDIVSNENGNDNNDVYAPLFTATINDETVSRTAISTGSESNTKKVKWLSTDAVNINGAVYTVAPDAEDATKATLTKESGRTSKGTYKAIYPASLYNNGTYELPAKHTYTAGQFNAPMYAESTGTELAFKNICAVLAIKVTKSDITEFKSIKVKSDKAMCGTFTISDNKAVLTNATDNSKTVELVSDDYIRPTKDGITLYIAIPAQEYQYLQIYLSKDGTIYNEAMATKKTAGLGTIERNKIFNIDYAKNAVQLWKDGPFFATNNAGTKTWSDGMNVWGSAWTLPSESDMSSLFGEYGKNTETYRSIREWTTLNETYGFKFTGNENYMDNYDHSIFLNANKDASHNPSDQGGLAQYWTSNEDGTDKAKLVIMSYTLVNTSGLFSIIPNSVSRTEQHFVRPVLK